MRIGIDFDNTIAGYDRLFPRLAVELGFLRQNLPGKRAVRAALHATGPDGDRDWQVLQALAYGVRMAEAELIAGVGDFLQDCRRRKIPVFIVSHKTRFASHGPAQVDLRQAALGWMHEQGFFAAEGLGLAPGQVYFEATRQSKLARIAALGCSHFIDDLEEIFLEPCFPRTVEAILFDPGAGAAATPAGRWRACSDWLDIREVVLGAYAQ